MIPRIRDAVRRVLSEAEDFRDVPPERVAELGEMIAQEVRGVAPLQYSTRDSSGIGWLARTEHDARQRIAENSEYTLWRRPVLYGEWEEVP